LQLFKEMRVKTGQVVINCGQNERQFSTCCNFITRLICMKVIPLLKVGDMQAAIRHYTEVLDFRMTWPEDTVDSPVVDLGHEEMEFQITTHESEKLFGSVIYVYTPDVDALFAKYKDRGLDTSVKPDSPVHQSPVDQTWGRREFYVTDSDGNTLRFCQNAPALRSLLTRQPPSKCSPEFVTQEQLSTSIFQNTK
jgi:uncharacterized glyoxalase superfamily protein PhnB